MLSEKTLKTICDELSYDHRPSCLNSLFMTEQAKITIACTALIMEELSEIKKQVDLIRGLQLYARSHLVNGKGEFCDPGDLSEQPVYEPIGNPGAPIPF